MNENNLLLRIKLLHTELIHENENKNMILFNSEKDAQTYLKNNDLYLKGAKIYDLEFNELCGYYAY